MGKRDRDRKLRVLSGEAVGHREFSDRQQLVRDLGVVILPDRTWTALDGKIGGGDWDSPLSFEVAKMAAVMDLDA